MALARPLGRARRSFLEPSLTVGLCPGWSRWITRASFNSRRLFLTPNDLRNLWKYCLRRSRSRANLCYFHNHSLLGAIHPFNLKPHTQTSGEVFLQRSALRDAEIVSTDLLCP